MDWHSDLELEAELEMRYEDTYDYQADAQDFTDLYDSWDQEDGEPACSCCTFADYINELDDAADREARWDEPPF